MKTLKVILTITFLGIWSQGNAQFFKKLADKAEKAAERTVERRVERESSKKTDKAIDGVFEGKKKKKKSKKSNEPVIGSSDSGTANNGSGVNIERAPDFEPGAVIIFEDDFARDNRGDFPAKWDTNGSGEIVVIDGKKWFRIGGKSTYVPMIKESLPENYTIEFDMLTSP